MNQLCQDFTDKGPQCSRDTLPGEIYCTQHLKIEEKEQERQLNFDRSLISDLHSDVFHSTKMLDMFFDVEFRFSLKCGARTEGWLLTSRSARSWSPTPGR